MGVTLGQRSPACETNLGHAWEGDGIRPDDLAALSEDLTALSRAVNYRDWLFSAAAPFVGRRVLEVGAGIGTMTACVADRELVVALETSKSYADHMRRAFADNPAVRVVEGDVTDAGLMAQLAEHRFDSAITFNVLEHIEDDVAALRGIHDALLPGGSLAALVPAGRALYCDMDRSVGHHRRYTRRELVSKARRVGFEVVQARHVNVTGYLLWLVRGRVMRKSTITGGAGRLLDAYDRHLVPRLRALEMRWSPPFGQSLLLVGRRLTEANS